MTPKSAKLMGNLCDKKRILHSASIIKLRDITDDEISY
jgi:hypothetical protein